MNSEKRGSEKLMDSCTGTVTLSPEELEQIGGGFGFAPKFELSSYRIFKVFPYGIIDPEVLQLDKLGQLEGQVSNGF